MFQIILLNTDPVILYDEPICPHIRLILRQLFQTNSDFPLKPVYFYCILQNIDQYLAKSLLIPNTRE